MKLNKILKLSAFTLLCTSSIMAAMGDNMTAGIGVTLGSTVQEQTWMDNSQHYGADGNGPLAGVSVGSSFALSDAATSATVFDFRNTYYQRVRTNAVGITAQHKLKTSEGSIHGVYGGIDYTSYDSMNFWQAALGAETMMLGYKGNLNFYIPFGDTSTYSGIGGSTMTGLYGVDLTLGKMIGMFGLGVQGSYFWNDDIKNNISAVAFGGEYTFAKNMLTTGAAYQYKNGLDSGDYGYKVFARVPLHKGTFSSLTGMNAADNMSTALLYKPVNRMVGGVLQAKDIDCSAIGGSSYSAGGVTTCSATNPFDGLELKAGANLGERTASTTVVNTPAVIQPGLYIIDNDVLYTKGLKVMPGAIFAMKPGAMMIANASQDAGVVIGSGDTGSSYVSFVDGNNLLKAVYSKGASQSSNSPGIAKALQRAGFRAAKGQVLGNAKAGFGGNLGSDITDSNHGVALVLYGKAQMFLSEDNTAYTGRPSLAAVKAAQTTGSGAVPNFMTNVIGDNFTTTKSTGGILASTATSTTNNASVDTQGAFGSQTMAIPASADTNAAITANTSADFLSHDSIGDGTMTLQGGPLKDIVIGGGTDNVQYGNAAILNKVIFDGKSIGALGANLLGDKLFFNSHKGSAISQLGGVQQISNSGFKHGPRSTGSTHNFHGVIATHIQNVYDASDVKGLHKEHSFFGASSNLLPRAGMVTRLASGKLSATAGQQAGGKNLVDAASKFSSINNERISGPGGLITYDVTDLNGKAGHGVSLSEVGTMYDLRSSQLVDAAAQKGLDPALLQGNSGQIGNNKNHSYIIPFAFTTAKADQSPSFSVTGRQQDTFTTTFNNAAGTNNDDIQTNWDTTVAQLGDVGLSTMMFAGNNLMLASNVNDNYNDGNSPIKTLLKSGLGFGSSLAQAQYKLSELSPTGANDTGATSVPKLAVEEIGVKPAAVQTATNTNNANANVVAENQTSANGTFFFNGAGTGNTGLDLTTASNLRAKWAPFTASSVNGDDASNGGAAGSAAGKVGEFGPLAFAFDLPSVGDGSGYNNSDGGQASFQASPSADSLIAGLSTLATGLNAGGTNNTTLSSTFVMGGSNFSDGTNTTMQNLASDDLTTLQNFFSSVMSISIADSSTGYTNSDVTGFGTSQLLGKIKTSGNVPNRAFVQAFNGFNTPEITSATGTTVIPKAAIVTQALGATFPTGVSNLITGDFPIGNKGLVYTALRLGVGLDLYLNNGGTDTSSSLTTRAAASNITSINKA